MGFFSRIKAGLKKTGAVLNTDIRDLFKSEGRLIDEGFLEEIRGILFRTDMGYDSTEASSPRSASNSAAASCNWRKSSMSSRGSSRS